MKDYLKLKTQIFDENKIYLSYKKIDDFENDDIIDIDCPHPESK